jgi:5-oxoprolinase (ATP-hydrolysing)
MEFWIDVGGTFTDCIGNLDDGCTVRCKVLSSGVTKGRAMSGSDHRRIIDLGRRADPADFWLGYNLRLFDHQGQIVGESLVEGFDAASGTLELAQPLPQAPSPGQSYEMTSGEESPLLAIRYMLALPLSAALPPVTVRLGTTRGTNALLTRSGAATALVTTRGFADVLKIGYQDRPKLFELAIRKHKPLSRAVIEVDERITSSGEVLREPDRALVRQCLAELKAQGIESLAVCLLNAYVDGRHEELVGQIAAEVGFREVSLSSRVSPLVKMVARGDTTVVSAYLNPVLRSYVARLRAGLEVVMDLGSEGVSSMNSPPRPGTSKLRILDSAGGLVDADQFVGKDSILSGPAGGVVGFSNVARAAGFTRSIGFDMGGTSTDVARYEGRYEREYETEKAGVRIVAPMMAIETVAAGGGSICRFDGVKLVVGPESAGASPGPSCYGRGGPLAVTDMNFYQGKILADRFPFPLDRNIVHERLTALADEVFVATGVRYSPHGLADGFLRVVNVNMVQAIRSVSLAKGCDPREYVLVAFGAAAGQHACAVAGELGMRQVLIHPDAGVLSAYGIGRADIARHVVANIGKIYSEQEVAALVPLFESLAAGPRQEVLAEGVADENIAVCRSLDLRYRGVDSALSIAEPASGTYADEFARRHMQLYGCIYEGRLLEIVAARVEVIGAAGHAAEEAQPCHARKPAADQMVDAYFSDEPQATAVFFRDKLRPGDQIYGPAIVCEPTSTTVIDPGWQGEVLGRGELSISPREEVGSRQRAEGSSRIAASCGEAETLPTAYCPPPTHAPTAALQADPVMLEVFNNQFAGIAKQMGITLRNTAGSVNVKERLDFSCALFTASGELVVNAPHIPVHLGAMGETVRSIIAANPAILPGDVFVTNDPYRGGAHLPDVTVVTPVHDKPDERDARLLFFAASRAHHAEIGGIVPGSMPPFSKNLAEEGVLIGNFKLLEAGRPRFDELRQLLLAPPYPSRSVDDNLSDIMAQVAANRRGASDLLAMVKRYSWPVVSAYMGHIQRAAEQKMRQALGKLPDGRYPFADAMDGDATESIVPIAVTVTIAGDEAVFDFTGTGPVVAGNLNATPAIVTSAVMYCLRCLIAEEIPLNQGVLAPVRIILPECMLNPPRHENAARCAAVVGGNVETSQRVVDVILGALGVAAASQGTMNNMLFGDATFGYYETICGGSGATPHAPGADAVHTHMTNTRITDPEVIERRYPVRVLEFSIRRGSGGAGRQRGGDGVVRRLQFLRPLIVSILSQRRGSRAPFGLEGGQAGTVGRNTLVRADGSTVALGGLAQFTAAPGDVLVIETPGGGGFGA